MPFVLLFSSGWCFQSFRIFFIAMSLFICTSQESSEPLKTLKVKLFTPIIKLKKITIVFHPLKTNTHTHTHTHSFVMSVFGFFFFLVPQKEEKHAKTMNTTVVHANHMLRECAIHNQGELELTLAPSSFLFIYSEVS